MASCECPVAGGTTHTTLGATITGCLPCCLPSIQPGSWAALLLGRCGRGRAPPASWPQGQQMSFPEACFLLAVCLSLVSKLLWRGCWRLGCYSPTPSFFHSPHSPPHRSLKEGLPRPEQQECPGLATSCAHGGGPVQASVVTVSSPGWGGRYSPGCTHPPAPPCRPREPSEQPQITRKAPLGPVLSQDSSSVTPGGAQADNLTGQCAGGLLCGFVGPLQSKNSFPVTTPKPGSSTLGATW